MGILGNLFVKKLIGLDLGTSAIKVIELTTENPPRFVAYERIKLARGTIGESGKIQLEAELILVLKKMFQRGIFSSNNVAIGLQNFSVFSKKILIPKTLGQTPQAELRKWVDKVSPLRSSEATFDYEVLRQSSSLGGNSGSCEVLLTVAANSQIEKLEQIASSANLNALILDGQSLAAANCFFFNYPALASDKNSSYLILDFGAASTKVIICEYGKPIFTEELAIGGDHCTEFISEELHIPFSRAEALKTEQPENPSVAPIIKSFLDKVTHLIWITNQKKMDLYPGLPLNGVLVCGGGSQLRGLDSSLSVRFQMPIRALNPLKHLVGSGEKMALNSIRDARIFSTVGVGLAFRFQGDKKREAKRAVLT